MAFVLDICKGGILQMMLQEYSEPQNIEGVEIHDLDWKADDGGEFFEIARLSNHEDYVLSDRVGDNPELQINYSIVQPNVTKAWHLHKKQIDYWIIPPHQKILIGLIDYRKILEVYTNIEDKVDELDFSTYTYSVPRMRIAVGHKPIMIRIPCGVAHGLKNIDTKPIHMVYLTSQHFQPNDEFRIRWNVLGAEFWNVNNG